MEQGRERNKGECSVLLTEGSLLSVLMRVRTERHITEGGGARARKEMELGEGQGRRRMEGEGDRGEGMEKGCERV